MGNDPELDKILAKRPRRASIRVPDDPVPRSHTPLVSANGLENTASIDDEDTPQADDGAKFDQEDIPTLVVEDAQEMAQQIDESFASDDKTLIGAAPEENATSADGESAAVVAQADRADSGEVIDDDMLEELMDSEDDAEALSIDLDDDYDSVELEGDTTTAPPNPPPSQPHSKVSKSDRRLAPTWVDRVFNEDYLRTLPFLTPKATRMEANFVAESLELESGSQILDLGCGYGRHAMELAAQGFHVVGLDNALPLLLRGADEAQRRGLNINFVHGDMRAMDFDTQFDGAFCLFSSFGFFEDDVNKKIAQRVAQSLKPGARFVIEVLNRDYLVSDLPSRVWWEGDGCVVLEEVSFNYFSSRVISNRSVVFDDGRQLEQEISMRSFSLHELGKLLHAAGFRVLEISGGMATRGRFFGAYSRDIVIVAEKRDL